MVIYLLGGVFLGRIHSIEIKKNRLDRIIAHVPINVRCSIFNEILPIGDWWSSNNGHWLIRAQAWAIRGKD